MSSIPRTLPPLARAAQRQQRRELDPLLRTAEQHIHAAFAQARADAAPVLEAFVAAYRAEYARLNADRDEEDEEGEEGEPRRVPLHWLVTSGWKARVTAALRQAADRAGQQSLHALTRAHDAAADRGDAHGSELIKAALQPGVNALIRSRRAHGRRARRGRRR